MTMIDDKYVALGGPAGFLGAAQFPEERITPNALGSYRHYAGGSIYGKFATGLAFEVHGLIRQKWADVGWENSFLGFPITDETPVPPPPASARGQANRFEGGIVAWTPATGAHEVHGAIRARWSVLGEEGGSLGFPTTDELITPDGRGRYNHFERGSIYWTPPPTGAGAVEVLSPIRDVWAAGGWEQGPVGYPVRTVRGMPGSGSTFQDFERGTIYAGPGGVFTRTVARGGSVFATGGHIINWGSFPGPLPDGDRIAVAFTTNATGNPNNPTILTLRAGPGITWWKAISVASSSGADILQVFTQDAKTSATMAIPAAMLDPSGMMLHFGKAKVFGIHTGMYWLGRPDQLLGSDVTFTWLAD
jgi:uncharacterized protein with LGFP repeats